MFTGVAGQLHAMSLHRNMEKRAETARKQVIRGLQHLGHPESESVKETWTELTGEIDSSTVRAENPKARLQGPGRRQRTGTAP